MSSATVTFLELEIIVEQEFYISFDSFDGNVDFSNVGAIELFVIIDEAVDLVIKTFAISGKPRVSLVAPLTANQCNFEQGCCNDIVQNYPKIISSSSPSTSSSSTTSSDNDNNRNSFNFYDEYFTDNTVSSSSQLASFMALASVLFAMII